MFYTVLVLFGVNLLANRSSGIGTEEDPVRVFFEKYTEAILQCGYESEKLIWSCLKGDEWILYANQGVTIDNAKYYATTNGNNGLYYRLHIRKVQTDDEGKYRCIANTFSYYIYLKVLEISNETYPEPIYAQKDKEAILQCAFESDGLVWQGYYENSWIIFANQNVINKDAPNHARYTVSKNQSTGLFDKLHISSAQLEDAILYRCRAVLNTQTKEFKDHLHLFVINIGNMSHPSTIFAEKGNNVTFQCPFESQKLTWDMYYNNKWTVLANDTHLNSEILGHARKSILRNQATTLYYQLHLFSIEELDEGDYRCTSAVNRNTEVFLHYFSLEVLDIANQSHPTRVYVESGKEAVLRCEFESSRLIWQGYFKDSWLIIANENAINENIPSHKKYSVYKNPSTGLFYKLLITGAESGDAMKYRCRAVLDTQPTEFIDHIQVFVLKNRNESNPALTSVKKGKTGHLNCTFESQQLIWEGHYNNTWILLTNNSEVYTNAFHHDRFQVSKKRTGFFKILNILNVQFSDEVEYRCKATLNEDQTEYVHYIKLDVLDVPNVTLTVRNNSLMCIGHPFEISCIVYSELPVQKIEWQKNMNTVDVDGTKYSGVTKNDPSLTINNIEDEDDSGIYQCKVTNQDGTSYSKLVTLKSTLCFKYVMESATTVLPCPWVADSDNTIRWKGPTLEYGYFPSAKNKRIEMIVNNDTRSIFLKITNVTKNDEGNYACIVNSSFADSTANVMLFIIDEAYLPVLKTSSSIRRDSGLMETWVNCSIGVLNTSAAITLYNLNKTLSNTFSKTVNYKFTSYVCLPENVNDIVTCTIGGQMFDVAWTKSLTVQNVDSSNESRPHLPNKPENVDSSKDDIENGFIKSSCEITFIVGVSSLGLTMISWVIIGLLLYRKSEKYKRIDESAPRPKSIRSKYDEVTDAEERKSNNEGKGRQSQISCNRYEEVGNERQKNSYDDLTIQAKQERRSETSIQQYEMMDISKRHN